MDLGHNKNGVFAAADPLEQNFGVLGQSLTRAV